MYQSDGGKIRHSPGGRNQGTVTLVTLCYVKLTGRVTPGLCHVYLSVPQDQTHQHSTPGLSVHAAPIRVNYPAAAAAAAAFMDSNLKGKL